MSHRDLQPHRLSVETETATRETAAANSGGDSTFFDSMLMYGWLANREQEVIRVNKSLHDWMLTNGHNDLAERIHSGAGVPVNDFLCTILRDESGVYEVEIGNIIKTKVEDLIRDVENLESAQTLADPKNFEKPGDETPIGSYLIQKTLQIIESEGTVLAGVRVVKPGAIRMGSNNERDRVDIITVCQIANTDNGWRVIGVQGQLQQAWIRVSAGIQAGTQAGTVGLMGRNMSHNIGSHALFYLEVEEADPERQRFYRYLRERMELLAGFSTGLSLSSTTERLGKVVNNFRVNTALLNRIAKSEDVQKVNIEFRGGSELEVALPAGVLGAQALYTILENNIRDSAKHGRSEGRGGSSLTVFIDVREPEGTDSQGRELKDEFVEVVISDDRGNYADASRQIEDAFGRLRIVDELGQLEPGNWGIKERFISAAILRGIRLQNISVIQGKRRDQPVNFIISSFEPKILRVTNVNGNLGWAFYLMKPKEILLVTDSDAGGYSGITVRSLEWLRENVDEPSEVRHKFVVIRVSSQEELDGLMALEDKLPHRLFVCAPEGAALPADSHFVPVDEESIQPSQLTVTMLYSKWVEWLVRQKRGRLSPHTPFHRRIQSWFSGSEKFIMPETVFGKAKSLKILTYDDAVQTFRWKSSDKEKYRPQRPVVLFDSHGTCKETADGAPDHIKWKDESAALGAAAAHYEPHEHNDPARQLDFAAEGETDSPTFGFECAEAALIRILIVDERLDPVSRSTKESHLYKTTAKWACTRNELFHWKGIDIKGGEYGQTDLPGEETLLGWVEDQGYDFLVLHKGIVDKLIKNSTTATAADTKVLMSVLFDKLKKHVRQLIIHTGRMSWRDLPEGCKFMALSNVDTWLRNNSSKVQIVEDICLLRRV